MRFTHLNCCMSRRPRKAGLNMRGSSRECTVAYTIEGNRITAGIAFRHPHDTFIKKIGSAQAKAAYEDSARRFYMNLPYDNIKVCEITDFIATTLSTYGLDLIPNLPYTKKVNEKTETDITWLEFSRR